MAKLTTARAHKLEQNAGTRTKVPTKQLSPKYQRMRKANAAGKAKAAAGNDPAALTAPLTPNTLGQQVTAATDMAYAPAEQELAGQAAQSQQIQNNIPAWFRDYKNAQAHATEATKQAYGAALGVQQRGADSLAGLDAQSAGQLQSGLQQGAAISGTAVSPEIMQLATQGALSRRQAGTAQMGLTAGLGATETAYRAGQQVVGAGQELKARVDETARGRNIAGKGLALAKEKGNYATTQRQKLIDSEHTKQLEDKAFGLNEQKAANDVAIADAGLKTKIGIANQSSQDRQAALATRQQVAAADRASREREGHLTRLTRKKTAQTIASSGVTPTEKRRRNTAVNEAEKTRTKAVGGAQSYVKHGIKDPSTLRTALQEDYPSAPPEVIDYALAAALGGKAKVTKKGQPNAAARYRRYLQKLADGSLAK